MSHRLWITSLLLSLYACSTPQTSALPAAYLNARTSPPPSTPTTVLSTGDGDTLRVQQDDKTLTIRLSCIDAPEINQPQGQAASALSEIPARGRLCELLPRDTPITLRIVDTDRYGRTVAEVYPDGQSINLQMVTEG